jgi:hypothetical protein
MPASFCSCRDAKDYLAGPYIMKNYRSCTHNYVVADRNTLFDCGVKTNMAITSNGNGCRQSRSRSDVYMIAQDTIVFHHRS